MSGKHSALSDKRQLCLFDALPATSSAVPIRAPTERIGTQMEIVNERDLPRYPDESFQLVERALGALPADRIWFTYRDIKTYFGISRATVARRVKDRLVPGIRIIDGRVQEDGSVRRFDRIQLRWLLLAARASIEMRTVPDPTSFQA